MNYRGLWRIMRIVIFPSPFYLSVMTRMFDIVAQRKQMGVPTNRAIKMANALILEEYLTSGQYGSTSQFAKQIGVSHTHMNRLLNMLNLPPDEIERILFETH